MTKYYFLDLTAQERETAPRDGMQWDTLNAEDECYDVFEMYRDNADDISDMEYVNELDFTYTDSEGVKHYVEVEKAAD